MEEAKTRFPEGLDYVIPLDTTLAVTEGLKEIEHTLFEAIALVILVVFIFLQGWRATLIPLLAVPVSLVGTFILFPDARILYQYAVAIRVGACHWIGGRRCDCGGGSCRAPHRTWIIAERGDRQSNGGGVRTCRCHRTDPLRSVHPHRVHSRNYGQDVSTIRGHHCGFGDLLGIQRINAKSGTLGNVVEAAQAGPWPPGDLLPVVQQGLWQSHGCLRDYLRSSDSKVVLCVRPVAGSVPGGGMVRRKDTDELPS